jgi:hypothetical protein
VSCCSAARWKYTAREIEIEPKDALGIGASRARAYVARQPGPFILLSTGTPTAGTN